MPGSVACFMMTLIRLLCIGMWRHDVGLEVTLYLLALQDHPTRQPVCCREPTEAGQARCVTPQLCSDMVPL